MLSGFACCVCVCGYVGAFFVPQLARNRPLHRDVAESFAFLPRIVAGEPLFGQGCAAKHVL